MSDTPKQPVSVDDTDDQSRSADQDQAQARATDQPTETGDKMIPKTRFDQVNDKRKAAEAALTEVVDELVEEVPEDMRELIPDLPAADRIKWIRKAQKAGLFGGGSQSSGPDSKRPGGKPPTDYDSMSPLEMRRAGYKS